MKEAVVFILDAYPSMNDPYPLADGRARHDEGGLALTPAASSSSGCRTHLGSTRLHCAKRAVIGMITDLMLQSVQNEVCVIVCKSPKTAHHKIASFDESFDLDKTGEKNIPFPNLLELTSGLTRPTVDLLRSIDRIETVVSRQEADTYQGDFCDAILLAADALYERTAKRKFKRKIVLVTDAGHEVIMDVQQTLVVIDSLRSMECQLHVIGLDFGESATFDEPAHPPSHDRTTHEDLDDGDVMDHSSGDEGNSRSDSTREDDDDDDNVDQFVYSSKEDREKLLISLAEKTGGQVIAATTMQQVLDADKGKKTLLSTKRKMEFRLAPGLSFDARYVLLMKKESNPVIKTEAVMMDESTGRAIVNALGQEMTDAVKSIVHYLDEDQPDDAVEENDRTTAVQYGADVIPMNQFDYDGIKQSCDKPPTLEILGYVDRSKISLLYTIGPPYVVSGHDSYKCCAAISALAKALHRSKKVALCTFVKTRGSDPMLGGLFPRLLPGIRKPVHLLFLQLPYAGDVKRLDLASFTEQLRNDVSSKREKKGQVCDELIDSLMLPSPVLCSGKVRSPFLRSWNQTLIQRAIHPDVPEIINVRIGDVNDPMQTPSNILDRARPKIMAFEETFELKAAKSAPTDRAPAMQYGKRKKKVLHYRDFLD